MTLSYDHAGPLAPTEFLNQYGHPTPGGLIGLYVHGTDTPADLWVDRDRSVATANPVVLDDQGNTPLVFAEPGVYDARRVVSGVPDETLVSVVVGVDDEDAVLGPSGAAETAARIAADEALQAAIAAVDGSDVDSVNGHTGAVVGLAEQDDLDAEVAAREDTDAQFDAWKIVSIMESP